jgi:hypothetical protein
MYISCTCMRGAKDEDNEWILESYDDRYLKRVLPVR